MNHTGMIYVPAGSFWRGSQLSPDEQPRSQLHLHGFHIDIECVTNQQFSEFVTAGGYSAARLWTPLGWQFIDDHAITRPN